MTHPASSQSLERIFLLSHMRAYTSLAGHILGSHPEINGYYEMHFGYEDPTALDKQLDALLADNALKPGSRYLFDKLLHNDYRLLPERLSPANIKVLIALAEPEHTIQSIVHLFAQKEIEDLYASPVEAANYYIARIEALADYGRSTSHPFYYFDAELWQRAPAALLPRLASWLELATPLSEQYRTFSHTGQEKKGDSSSRIHSGRIDKTPVDYSHVAIPEESLNAAKAAYQACRKQLIKKAADALLV